MIDRFRLHELASRDRKPPENIQGCFSLEHQACVKRELKKSRLKHDNSPTEKKWLQTSSNGFRIEKQTAEIGITCSCKGKQSPRIQKHFCRNQTKKSKIGITLSSKGNQSRQIQITSSSKSIRTSLKRKTH